MPVAIRTPIRRLSQAEFGDLAYAVMNCIFEVHSELGRFFDEKIYKSEIAHRVPEAQLEVPIEIRHGCFCKELFLDFMVASGAVFEFKTAKCLTPRHRAQLLHYLLLADLAHGKLVNLRPEKVEHEFVNTTLTHRDRVNFEIETNGWNEHTPGAGHFRETLTGLLRDWGAGLDLQLYEEAMTHLLGGGVADVEVRTPDHLLGHQKMRLAAPGVAFKLTALDATGSAFESHTRRLLQHLDLKTILWANVGLKRLTFTTIESARPKTEKWGTEK